MTATKLELTSYHIINVLVAVWHRLFWSEKSEQEMNCKSWNIVICLSVEVIWTSTSYR